MINHSKKYIRSRNNKLKVIYLIMICITILDINRVSAENEIDIIKNDVLKQKIESIQAKTQNHNKDTEEENTEEVSRGEVKELEKFKITFYDLSVQSCGKRKSHPEYGITVDGTNLRGKNWNTARVIAVDQSVIALGTEVIIIFVDEKYSYLSGRYVSHDTGSKVKGKHIDIFLEDVGEQVSKTAMDLGVAEAYVEIIK